MFGSDSYVIRLNPCQSVQLYGFTLEAKKTLTWRDVQITPTINLRECINCNIEPQKLYKLQPNIKEWIKYRKAQIDDIQYLDPWKPNPFTDFNCNLGDLIMHRECITSHVLTQCKVSFKDLYEKYGLNYESMVLIGYTLDEWIDLGLRSDFIQSLSDDQIKSLFGSSVNKTNLLEKLKYSIK